MKYQKIFILATLLTLCVCFFLAGCGKKKEQAAEVLNYRLKWLFNISVAGDLYADDQGIFESHGLSVAVKSGGPERDAIKELEIGRAQFGVASADQVVRAIDKGAPIVVIAQLFQVNPLQWIFRQNNLAIDSPEDLKNKTIGITYGGNDETIMRALLNKQGSLADKVKLFSVRYDYSPFFTGEVDLWPVYRNAEGIVMAEKLHRQGEAAGFFNPDAFGVRFVANSVITTRRMISEHPETVQKFLEALLQGWQEALDPRNAKQTIDMVSRYDKETSRQIIAKQLDSTRNLMLPPAGKSFGWIDVASWTETERIMLDQKLISSPVGIEKNLQQITFDSSQ
ncbi:MAG: ABC transporter substrate-binding protein [Desulfobulbaceae bacterium]|nr:ABC transporter substrate-binding protein [Desulfobulbaceae bacterium]